MTKRYLVAEIKERTEKRLAALREARAPLTEQIKAVLEERPRKHFRAKRMCEQLGVSVHHTTSINRTMNQLFWKGVIARPVKGAYKWPTSSDS